MKRASILFFIIIFSSLSSFSQTDCNKSLNGDDALRWRAQMDFVPQYHSLERFKYLITSLSDRAYTQISIELSVSCYDVERKKDMVANMYYFWDKKISIANLNTYYPAYYLFYQLDKAGIGRSE